MRALVALGLVLSLAACAAPDTAPAPKAGGGKVALPEAPPPPTVSDPVMCTMDAKLCPDGSYVSRNPAKGCAFNPCPGAAPR